MQSITNCTVDTRWLLDHNLILKRTSWEADACFVSWTSRREQRFNCKNWLEHFNQISFWWNIQLCQNWNFSWKQKLAWQYGGEDGKGKKAWKRLVLPDLGQSEIKNCSVRQRWDSNPKLMFRSWPNLRRWLADFTDCVRLWGWLPYSWADHNRPSHASAWLRGPGGHTCHVWLAVRVERGRATWQVALSGNQ